LDPTCGRISIIPCDDDQTYLFPDAINSNIRSNRSDPLGNSLEAIHELALALVCNLVLCAQVIHFDKVAILVDELAVGIRASVFDLGGCQDVYMSGEKRLTASFGVPAKGGGGGRGRGWFIRSPTRSKWRTN
jgi:hypothetical protein